MIATLCESIAGCYSIQMTSDSDDWSADEIRALMNAPAPPGAAGEILRAEIERSSGSYPPEVINLAFQSFVGSFVDPALSIERRAEE